MRTILRGFTRAAAVAMVVGGAFALAAPTSDAVEIVDLPGIDVVQIEGLIDPPNASLLLDAIDDAEARDSTLLVIQLDSGGALDVDVDALARRVAEADVPIVAWIGPAGSGARGAAAYIATHAHLLSMATNAKIGPSDRYPLDHTGDRLSVADRPTERLGADDAKAAGIADRVDASLRNLLTDLDGGTIETPAGPVELATVVVTEGDDGEPVRQLNQDLRFTKLAVTGQLLHTLDAPWVAYFLLVVGLSLIVFEFYAASVGTAAIVGGLALIGAFTGFSHLPVTVWGLALIVFGLFGLTVDLQAGGVGFWTGTGTLALIGGSITLYGGSARLDPPWWTIVIVVLGTVVFFVGGMSAMLRTRFSTPTVGREGMVGELGVAEVDIAPEGVVRVREALWKARVNRATPLRAGDALRVVSVEGLVLEVEPLEGAAKDYRERSKKHDG